MKQLLHLAWVLIALIPSLAFADTPNTVQHIVKQGETIESIAARYGISPSDIVAANNMLFIGQEITIPVVAVTQPEANVTTSNVATTNVSNVSTQQTTTNANTASAQQTTTTPATTTTASSVNPEYQWAHSWKTTFELAVGFPKSTLTFAARLIFDYYFTNNAFAGVGVGYQSTDYDKDHFKSTNSLITIPVNVGYKFGEKFAVTPYAGVDFNLRVGGSTKYKNEKLDGDHESFGMEAKVGLRFMYDGYYISGTYQFPINDGQKSYVGKDSYIVASIGFTF